MDQIPEPEETPGAAEEEQPQEDAALQGSGYAFRRFDRESQGVPAAEEAEPPEEMPDVLEDVTEALAENSEPDDTPDGPAALTITFQSWATPVVGLVMLIVGLVGGYFVRPFLTQETAAPTAADTGGASAPESQAQASPEDRAALMEALLPQVRHFMGDENAPITLIEFSDFQ